MPLLAFLANLALLALLVWIAWIAWIVLSATAVVVALANVLSIYSVPVGYGSAAAERMEAGASHWQQASAVHAP